MSQEMRRLIDRIFELWNTGDLTIIDEILAPDYVNHDPTLPQIRDVAAFKEHVVRTREMMPDFHVEEKDSFFSADRIATRWIASGTQKGEMMGVPPTGRRLVWEGVNIGRVVDGKLVEGWRFQDWLGVMQQLGVIPETPQPEASRQ